MYFTKIERKYPDFYAVNLRYAFYTECSKGTITITPGGKSSPYYGGKILGGSPPYRELPKITYWGWEVKRWVKAPEGPRTFVPGGYIRHSTTPPPKQCDHSYGREPTLYRAAKAALQRLFTYRRCPLPELMKMLVNDQVVYELSKIGGPS